MTGQTAPAGLDEQLCFALHSASRTVTAAYRQVLSGHGLTYPQYLVLLALWERDARTVRELGEALRLDSGTLSPLLRRMEARGLLTRTRDERDARLVTVRLTDEGHALRARGGEVQACLTTASTLTPTEMATLHELAQRLVAGLA